MKKLLLIGLIVSISSILMTVFVTSHYLKLIDQKSNRKTFLRSRNLVLSNEFSDAEHFKFFSDFYLIDAQNRLKNLYTKRDSVNLKNVILKRDQFLIKSLNYAYNATILNPLEDYDSLKIDFIKKLIILYQENNKNVNSTKGFSNTQVNEISASFSQYYKEHEQLIKSNNEEIRTLDVDISKLNLTYEWAKTIAIILQVIGLILVFLKDYKTTPSDQYKRN